MLGGLRSVRLLLASLLTSASLAALLLTTGESTNSVLYLLDGSSGGILGLPRHLSGLVGRLTRHLLGLPRHLSRSVLRLLGRSLCGLLDLLLGLLGGLVHRVLDARVLSRLIHRALELHVGVDHLLDLGLCVALGDLLRILLQLRAVPLYLAPEAAYLLRVEVLGLLCSLLLHLLLKIRSLLCHFASILFIDFRFQ